MYKNFYSHGLGALRLLSIITIFCALFWLSSSSPLTAQTHDPQAQDLIELAWDKVEEVDSYSFRTQLVQQVYSAPSIASAGRPPQTDTLGISGTYDADSYRMETTIWSDGTFDPNTGIDMLIENGRSYVRQPQQTEWEEINDFSDSFAPGGDPISFLSGMSNVQETGMVERSVGPITLNFTTYTFELDGPAMATYVNKVSTQMLQQQGELPNGMTSTAGEGFREMAGQGQVWIGEDGYLARIELDLTLDATEDGERVEAQLTSDFYDYVLPEPAVSPSFINDPAAWLSNTVTTALQPENMAKLSWILVATVTLVLLVLFIWHTFHSKAFHSTLASLIIVSMILPPFLHTREAQAYYDEQHVRYEQQQERAKSAELVETVRAEAQANDWDPQTPASVAEPVLLDTAESPEAVTELSLANSADSSLDSDNDGVNDADEALWDSCPYANPSTNYNNEEDCSNVTDPSDSDGDTLPDYAEIYELGTLPDMADSDGDDIPDYLEVQGFSYNGTQWYLNPLESDSNNDGQIDSLECPLWNSTGDDFDGSAICPDTDNDGTPDLFDVDDDGDGVWDIDDSAPAIAGEIYDDANPLELSIDGLETDKPVLVELEFRPTDPDLLTYSGLVLDWPGGDYEGQIVRGLETTFESTSNTDAQSTDAKAAYGDLKIVPVLEVLIPYSDGHYGNLPVNGTYAGIDRTIGITVDQWIDDTELDTYAISVTDVDETSGDLTAYVPLSTLHSEYGDSPMAFSATMVYQPSQGTGGIADWGEAHQYRLAWMVQMITDSCVADVDEDGDGDPDNEEYEDCTRQDELSIVHIYQDEPWQLTGLSISEEHGFDVAQLYENPASDPDLNVEDQLWLYAWNMTNTFIEGLDCDSTTTNGDGTVDCVGDGTRDVTLADLSTKIDEWGDGSNYVAIDGIDSYPHDGYLGYVATTETPALLDSVFSAYTASQQYTSMLIAYETTNRSIDVASATDDGNGGLSFDLTDEATNVMAGMTWKTFSYDDDTAAWAEADTEAYLEYLTEYLETNDSFFAAEDDSDEAADEVEGKLLWFQSYYLTLAAGLAGWVEYDDSATGVPSFDSTSDSADFLNDIEALYDVATASAARRLGSFLSYYISDLVLKTDLTNSTWAYMRLIYSADDLSTYEQTGYFASKYGSTTSIREYKHFKLFGSQKLAQMTVQDGSLKMVKTSLKVFVVGAAFVAAGTIFDTLGLSDVGNVLIMIGLVITAVASITLTILEATALISKLKLISSFTSSGSSTIGKGAKANSVKSAIGKTYRVHAAFGAAVGIGIAVISFGFTLSSMGTSPAGYEVAAAAAYLIAQIIVEFIFFMIGLIVPVGTLIVLFIELVDIILLVLSYIFDDIPKTISGAITEAIAESLYDFDLFASNMEDENRLLLDFDWNLADPELGYVRSNSLIFSTTVTNTLWTEDFSREQLEKNSFAYAVSKDPTVLDDVSLSNSYNSDDWESIDYDDYVLTYPDAENYGDEGIRLRKILTTTLSFADAGTGINTDLSDTFFLEKYRLKGEGCWNVQYNPFQNIEISCKEYAFKDSAETELPNFTFDIFPNSLAEFVSLSWQIGIQDQYDQDGDGVINQVLNGADPNDRDADSDDDGIHDYFEIVDGLDPEAADGDGDGLNDWEELYLYDTDPTLADSDNDGLTDHAEAKTGWIIAYTDSAGSTQLTRIWSDPNVDDIDDDGLGDLQEMIYGFNPNVANDSSVIDNLIEIEDIELDEVGGPQLLLKLEEGEDDTVVTDHSGYDNNFICESTTTCPETDVDGVYGQAFSFDGSNDYLETDFIQNPADTEFTAAVWFNPEAFDTGTLQKLISQESDNGADAIWLGFLDDGGFYSFVNGAVMFGNLDAPTDEWSHGAVTYDGTTLSIYFNGELKNSISVTAAASTKPIRIGVDGNSNSNYFKGDVDEVAIFDRALTEDEIGGLMNGRYNTNDLIVRPGAELSYQTTVTNTSALRNASGFLYANSNIASPEVAEPVLATGFEVDQRLAYFPSEIEMRNNDPASESGGILYCIDDGTCPTAGATGAFNTSLNFDGVDDVVYAPKLSSDITELYDDENQIFFWMYVDAYPTSGNAMILDTDDSSDGAMDIYIDSSGYLHFDSVGYGDGTSPSTIPLNTWTHIGYRNGEELTINGGDDGQGDIIATNSDDSSRHPVWGPGRLGNSLDGSQPFDGRIDEIAIYHGFVGDTAVVDHIYTGDYFDTGSGLRADAVFDLDQLIADDTNSNVGYLNLVNGLREVDCASTSIGCPIVISNGQYGDALTFDGTNDGLDLDSMAIAKSDYTLGMWFKTSGSAEQTLLSADDGNGLALQLYLNASGQPRFLHRFPGGASGGSELSTSTAANDGTWHYLTAVKEEETLYLYIDGELVDSVSGVTAAATDTIALGLGYDVANSNSFFDGEIDELTIIDEAVDLDGVSYLMNSRYPAIEISTVFEAFELDAQITAVPSGTATVAENIESGSVHQFEQEVEVAFDLTESINVTTYNHEESDNDEDGSDLTGYFRFEETPGSTTFENQVLVETFGSGSVNDFIVLNATCSGTGCPIVGVNGVDGRALYFDGIDDYLHVNVVGDINEQTDGTFDDLPGSHTPDAQSISVWVNGSEGTIFNRGKNANDFHFQVDFGRVSFVDGFDNYTTFEFDMPINQWTHLVAAISDAGILSVYVDGVLQGTLDSGSASADIINGDWHIGSNHGTQNHFKGYMDDLRVYEVEVDLAAAQELYENSLPRIRFEFDEASDETNFVDSISGYVAEPATVECVDLTLETLTVQEIDAELTNLTIEVGGEMVYYGSVDDFGAVVTDTTPVSQTLNVTTPICATSQTITASAVYSDGSEITFSGSASATLAEAASADAVFTESGQEATLSFATGAPYNTTSPVAGKDGRIGNTLFFPGNDEGYLEMLDSAGLGEFATSDFTVMGWIKTDQNDMPIWAKDDGDGLAESGEKVLALDSSGQLIFTSYGASSDVHIYTTEVINDSQWHHFVVTWDYDGSGTGGSYAIYVDGVDVTDSGSSTYTAVNADNGSDSWKIGRSDSDSGDYGYFDGELDELTFYTGRALESGLVYETYLREARWYRDSARFSVLVDDDAPTLTLQTNYRFFSGGTIQLVATPDDPTSAIQLVQFGVKGPSDGDYTWDTAGLCADSGVAYCPNFSVSESGQHDIVFRIVDSVGNETTSETYDFYVDQTGPNVSGDSAVVSAKIGNSLSSVMANSEMAVSATQISDSTWHISLSGDISDPDLDSGISGSGVDDGSLYITVLNSALDVVGAPNQTATVNEDGSWTIDYEITGNAPAGRYYVEASAEDEVENRSQTSLGTFSIDMQSPFVGMAHRLWPKQIISATHVISGVVTDQPDWTGAEIALHFEEGDDEKAYYNYGGEQDLLACSNNCPDNTFSGAFGRGLDFADGSQSWALDSAVISDSVNFDNNDNFTIAFWVQPAAVQLNTGQETNSLIEKWGDGTSYPYSISLYNSTSGNAGKIVASRSDGTNTPVLTSTTTLGTGFYHVALVKDGEDLILYVDGVAEMTVTDTTTGDTTNSDSLTLGHRSDSSDYTFTGILDELFIYDLAQTSSDVYAMAQIEVNGSNQVELAFEAIDFATYPDVLSINDRQGDVTWQSATVDLPTGLGSSWSYTMSDMEDWYYIHLRGQDSGGNESDAETVWHGLIDHVEPTIVATGEQSGAGDSEQTVYTFTITDFLLNQESAVYPCGTPDITEQVYNDTNLPYDGLTYEISGTCTIDEFQSSGTFSICDVAGHCVSENVVPTVSNDVEVALTAEATSVDELDLGITTTLAFTITRSGDTARSSSVDFDFAASTATQYADFNNVQVSGTGINETDGTITFDAGAETANITLDLLGDDVDETDEEIVLTLSSATGTDVTGVGILVNSPITTTIVDDDSRDVLITGADSRLQVTEGSITDTYTIALASEPTEAVTITLGLDNNQVDLGAGAGGAISLTYSTLNWMTPQTVTVTAIDDNFVEMADTTTISHTVVGGDYVEVQPINITITVTDNDIADVQITPTALIITETGVTTANFLMTLLSEPTAPVTVTLSADDSTECTVSPTELTLAPIVWNTGITATVSSVDETSDDGDQICTIVTSMAESDDADYDGLEVVDVSTVVIDDDGLPSINFSALTITTTEDANTLVLSVGLSNPSDSAVEVTVTSNENGATSGVDYMPVSETITFAPLQTSATVTVTILEDTIDEPTESLTLTLSSPVAAGLGLVDQIGIEIEDNDLPPAISLSSDAISVGELDGTLPMTVSLSHASASTVTVMLQTTNLTATAADLTSAGADYTAISQTTTFAPGELSQMVNLSILDDGVYEEAETFTLKLSDPDSGILGDPSTALITIVDDELPPIIEFSSGTASVGEADGPLPVTLTLSHAAASTVTVMLDSADLTATAGADYTAISQTVAFAPGELSQLVNIRILDDDTDEEDEAFSLGLSNLSNGSLGTETTVEVIIIDNDLPAVSLTFLPMMRKDRPRGADLIVDSIDLADGSVEITIKNVGTNPVDNTFWVDLFVNPSVLPTRANDTIGVLNQPGLVWGIDPSLVPLAPDGEIKLAVNDGSFAAELATFSGTIAAGDLLVAHVDSANNQTTYGAVNESHEAIGGMYNNITSMIATGNAVVPDLVAERRFNSDMLSDRP